MIEPSESEGRAPDERPAGIFISRDTLIIVGAIATGIVTAALVLLVPKVGVPVGTGLAAAGLLYTWLAGHRR